MVVGMARSLLKSMGVPNKLWGQAVTTAVYLLNRAPTKSVRGMTPYEAWHGRKPSVQHLRTSGCVAHVKKVGPGQTKLADISKQMVFIGNEAGSKAYRVFDPDCGKLVVTRDVVFEEDRSWDWSSWKSMEPLVITYSDQASQTEGQTRTERCRGRELCRASGATAGKEKHESIRWNCYSIHLTRCSFDACTGR
jgi:hypothetical protein